MRKLFSVVILAMLALTSTAFAQRAQHGMKQGHAVHEHEMMPGYNNPARYDVCGSWDLYFKSDFLYMQAREMNLAYAVTTSDTTFGRPPINGNVLNPDFSWHPGVRLGLGFSLGHDHWDVYSVWTHLVVHDNTASDRPNPGILIPVMMHGISDSLSPERATSSWRMIFNTVDITLGRAFYSGRHLTFKPHIGVRGGWIKQTLNVSYENLTDAAFVPHGTSQVTTDFDTWGVGPKFAVDTNWMLGMGFRLFGDIASSILYTSYDATKTETNPNQAVDIGRTADQPLLFLKNKDNDIIAPNLEGRLGFGWGTYFDRNNWHIDLSVAYEMHYWPNQNGNGLWVDDTLDVSLTRASGDLAIHGASFSFRLDF